MLRHSCGYNRPMTDTIRGRSALPRPSLDRLDRALHGPDAGSVQGILEGLRCAPSAAARITGQANDDLCRVESPLCGPTGGPGHFAGRDAESDWRQLFITGATPEQAADQVRVNHYNTPGRGADAQALTDDRPASQVTISDYRPRRGGATLPVLGGSAGGQRSLLRIHLGPVKMQPSAGPILRRLNRTLTRPD
jgi:hypothetical protein